MSKFDDLKEFVVLLLICIAALLAITFPIFLIARSHDIDRCQTYKEVTGKETTYRTGMCFIKDGDNWYVWSEYKLRNATKGLK